MAPVWRSLAGSSSGWMHYVAPVGRSLESLDQAPVVDGCTMWRPSGAQGQSSSESSHPSVVLRSF